MSAVLRDTPAADSAGCRRPPPVSTPPPIPLDTTPWDDGGAWQPPPPPSPSEWRPGLPEEGVIEKPQGRKKSFLSELT